MTIACDPLPLDQVRAGGISKYQVRSPVLADDSVLTVDLAPPAQLTGKHWVIEHLCFTGFLTKRAPNNGTPVNGLFLCPPGTDPVENLALASVAPGVTFGARPICLPISERAVPSELLPSGVYLVNMTMQPGFKASLPGGWFLRAIVTCSPGTATPGPGAGSFGALLVTAVVESDK